MSWARATIGILFLALLTIAGLAMAVHFWRTLPVWDQWEAVFLYQRWVEHGWSGANITAQHNEHRHVLTNLLFLADFEFFRGTSLLVGTCLILVQLALGALLGVLITIGDAPASRAFGVALSIALVASPFQIDNLILPFHIAIPLVCLLALLAFYWTARATTVQTPAMVRIYTIAACVAIVLCPYAMANGLIASVMAALLALVLGDRRETKLTITLMALMTVAAYFWGWVWPKHHEALLASASGARGLLQIPAHSLVLLGSPGLLAGGRGAGVVGLIGVVLWMAALAILVARWRRGLALDAAVIALFSLASFALMTAVMVASGRAGAGLAQALSARYATFSLVFWISLLGTIWRLSSVERSSFGSVRRAAWGMALTLLVLAYAACFRAVDSWRAQVAILDRVTAELNAGQFDPAQLVQIYPDINRLRSAIEFLRQRQLSIFARP